MSVELVQNGNFSSAQNWDVQNLWSVSNGKGRYNMGSTQYQDEYLGQSVNITAGTTYRLSFKIDTLDLAGTTYLSVSLGGVSSSAITEAGSYNISITPENTDDLKFEVLGSGAQQGDEITLDDVSLIYQAGVSFGYASKNFYDGQRTITKLISNSEYQG